MTNAVWAEDLHNDPMDLFQQSPRSRWRILACVIALHLACLAIMTITFVKAPIKKAGKKIVVHTVQLAKPAAPSMRTENRQTVVESTPIASAAPEPIAEVKSAPKVEEVAPPQAEPVIERPAPTPTPKPASKPSPKPISKPTPKPVSKPKSTPKPAPKPVKKTPPQQKLQAKAETKPKPDQKAADKAKADLKAKTDAEVKRQKEAKDAEDRENARIAKNCQEALASLDSAGSLDSKKSALSKSQGAFKGSSVQAISSLASESLVQIDNGDETLSPRERTYYDELVSRLKLSLKLPEYGEVKLQLTLSRTGNVVKITSIKSKSKKNSSYIEKTIPKLKLPPFGQNFSGEKEHTFKLTLSNELNY